MAVGARTAKISTKGASLEREMTHSCYNAQYFLKAGAVLEFKEALEHY
jgi:hypothetical protein